MTNQEAIDIIKRAIAQVEWDYPMEYAAAFDKAIEALITQGEPEYPVCERCGKKIDRINTSVFNYDGTDLDHSIPILYEPYSGCITFTTTPNWTDYDLTDEERKEGIRCPYCRKYPFDKDCEIELYEPVNVMMWVTRNKNDND